MAERKNGLFRLEVDYIKAINREVSHAGRYTAARKYRRSWVKEQEARDEDEVLPEDQREDPTKMY
jgi:hypothetical protein